MSKNTDLGSLVNYIKGQVTGRLNAPAYTSATAFTGTIAGYLGFDTSGNILTSAGVGFTGSGTTNYVAKFTGSTTLGNSNIQDSGTALTFGVASTFSSTGLFQGASLTIGSAVAATNVKLFLNGVASKAAGIEFQQSGVSQWLLGNGAASEDNNFELYNSNGTMAMKIIKATNAINFIGTFGVTGAATFSSSASEPIVINSTNATTLNTSYKYNNGTQLGYIGTGQGLINGGGSTIFAMRSENSMAFSVNGGNIALAITAAMEININTSTTGYTLNAIRSTSTSFNTSYRGGGAFAMQIMARFIEASTGRGAAIGYSDSGSISGIFATQSGFGLHIWTGSAFKLKITMNSTTVGLDIPTSSSGLTAGDLYNDGGTVKIFAG